MIRFAFMIGAFLAAAMLSQKVTRAEEIRMKFPPAKMAQNERLLNADEISALSCTDMARKFVESIVKAPDSIWTLDMSGETASHDDEFGYVYRYGASMAIKENGKNYNHEYIFVAWSKDCKSMGIASFPTLELNLPRSSKGR